MFFKKKQKQFGDAIIPLLKLQKQFKS